MQARWPLAVATVCALDYGLFAWAVKFADTAIVSTVMELWPVVLTCLLTRAQNRAAVSDTSQPGGRVSATSGHAPLTGAEQAVIGLLAVVALIFLLASQQDAPFWSVFGSVTLQDTYGIGIALAAAVLAGAGVAATFAYGNTMFDGFRRSLETQRRDGAPEAAIHNSYLVVMWFTLACHAISKIAAAALSLLIGVLAAAGDGFDGGFSPAGAVGAVLVGAISGTASILLRYGNIVTRKPGNNMLFTISPVLALLWLAFVGIHIPRMGLFLTGASLMLAINAAIRLKPLIAANRGRPKAAAG